MNARNARPPTRAAAEVDPAPLASTGRPPGARRPKVTRAKTPRSAKARARAEQLGHAADVAALRVRVAAVEATGRELARDVAATCGGCGLCDDCEALEEGRDTLPVLREVADALARIGGILAGLGRPAPKARLPACGARTRKGLPCRARVVARALWSVPGGEVRSRCRMHGGASTGPTTADGRARSLAALARGRELLAARRAKGS